MMNISHDNLQSAIFAGGCFWCVEADFDKRPDIKDIESGYIGGETEDPSYDTAAENGHREAVRIWYDPEETNYKELLAYFFSIHDPTDSGGSFYDRGHAYTSAIYCQNPQQEKLAATVIEELQSAGVFDQEIVTEIRSAGKFWPAEEYHQNYAEKNPEHYQQYRQASGRDDFKAEHKEAVFKTLDL